MMGQSPEHTTQGGDEGSPAPLVSRSSARSVWKPILRKVAAVTLGGLGLAGIGALSMAQPSTTGGGPNPPSPALAGVVAPTEWLAPAPSSETPTRPPCPPGTSTATLSDGQAPAGTETETTARPGAPAGAVLSDGRIVLNLASTTELTTLPGVGLKRAEAIIALRTKLKGFRKLSDLLRVKGIGVKSLKKLEPKLVLDAPAPAG